MSLWPFFFFFLNRDLQKLCRVRLIAWKFHRSLCQLQGDFNVESQDDRRVGSEARRGLRERNEWKEKTKPLQISGKNLFGREKESGDADWGYFLRSWLKLQRRGQGKDHIPLFLLWKLPDSSKAYPSCRYAVLSYKIPRKSHKLGCSKEPLAFHSSA